MIKIHSNDPDPIKVQEDPHVEEILAIQVQGGKGKRMTPLVQDPEGKL